jgi:hypothetical protein
VKFFRKLMHDSLLSMSRKELHDHVFPKKIKKLKKLKFLPLNFLFF